MRYTRDTKDKRCKGRTVGPFDPFFVKKVFVASYRYGKTSECTNEKHKNTKKSVKKVFWKCRKKRHCTRAIQGDTRRLRSRKTPSNKASIVQLWDSTICNDTNSIQFRCTIRVLELFDNTFFAGFVLKPFYDYLGIRRIGRSVSPSVSPFISPSVSPSVSPFVSPFVMLRR